MDICKAKINVFRGGKVSFTYKDYADKGKQKTMTLDSEEFLRRFCLHILPPKFMKIRRHGILASRYKPLVRKYQFSIGIIAQSITKKDWKEITLIKLNFDVDKCPCCKTGIMIRIQSFDANAPTLKLIVQIKNQTNKKNTIA